MDEKRGLVIDPYCGSGTTLVAAKILGNDYIGIEISPEYVDFAEKRLLNYNSETKFALEEISKHAILKTFKERKEKGEFTGKYRNSKEKNMAFPFFQIKSLNEDIQPSFFEENNNRAKK